MFSRGADKFRTVLSGTPLPALLPTSGVPKNFFSGGGVQQIQLRTEDREDRDLGAVAP